MHEFEHLENVIYKSTNNRSKPETTKLEIDIEL